MSIHNSIPKEKFPSILRASLLFGLVFGISIFFYLMGDTSCSFCILQRLILVLTLLFAIPGFWGKRKTISVIALFCAGLGLVVGFIHSAVCILQSLDWNSSVYPLEEGMRKRDAMQFCSILAEHMILTLVCMFTYFLTAL